jgi:hypothetical protein
MAPKKYHNIDDQNDPGSVNDPQGIYHTQQPLTFEKVWLMFQEIGKMMQESDKKFQEYREERREASREYREEMREASLQTTKKFRETDKRIKEAFDLFTGQWGKLVESLVEGDLPRVLQERGITVKRTVERAKSEDDKGYEFDIIAVNCNVCVVVEVKTTLRQDDITHFLNKLKNFRKLMPEYENKTHVMGAVAYIRVNSNSDKMAEKNGLFTIRATGKSAKIVNAEDFEPKQF